MKELILKLYDDNEKDKIYACLDECARGPLFGDVYASAVITNNYYEYDDSDEIHKIKDSKKLSANMREVLYDYIKENLSIDYSIQSTSNKIIDEINILNATYKTMHTCLDNLNLDFDKILVDGTNFKPYKKHGYIVPYKKIIKGDNIYIGIAAASILAKVEHDRYIQDHCDEYPEHDDRYDLRNNKGYGSPKHIEGIHKYGITEFHRKSFNICSGAEKR